MKTSKMFCGLMALVSAFVAVPAGYADDVAYHNLAAGAFFQDWSNTGLITANDDWSNVPSIIGYLGDGLVSTINIDPQTVLADNTTEDVNANKNDPSGFFVNGGVTEFEIADPTISIKGSATADAPFIVIHLNTIGVSGVKISYNLRDIDASARNTVSSFALQYRIGNSGDFTNIAEGYVGDATTGPGIATKVTPVSVLLPSATNNQTQVQVRIITTNAFDTDEFVGIDDIKIENAVIPETPSGLTAAVISMNQVALSWTHTGDNEDGFIIERLDPGIGWVQVGITGPNASGFTDTVPYVWLFSYRVAAFNAHGKSAYTEAVMLTSWAPSDPYPPQNIVVNGSYASHQGASITVPENLPKGTFIGTISSTDETPDGDSHTYTLFSTPNGPVFCNPWFYIQGNQLFMKKPFDYESKPGTCTIHIRARDSHGNFRTDHIVVAVEDIDEPPSDLLLNRNSVDENQPAGTEIGKFATKDDEKDTLHTYSLVSGQGDTDNSLFVIENNVLKTAAVLDYENKSALNIRVMTRADDGSSLAKEFIIEVLNSADPPMLSDIEDISTDDEVPVRAYFTVRDQDTHMGNLKISASSDNPRVVPDANIELKGTGADRSLILTPVKGEPGTASITLTASDGTSETSKSFLVSVTLGPNLRITAKTDSDTVPPGGILRLSALISNTGDRDAAGVRFVNPVPENTEYISGNAVLSSGGRAGKNSVSYTSSLNQIEWTGDIAAGQTAEIVFEIRICPDAARGTKFAVNQGVLHYDGETGHETQPALILVEGCLKGDTDGSGIIDLRDAVQALKAVAGVAAEELCADADANNDGKIGTQEAVYILNTFVQQEG